MKLKLETKRYSKRPEGWELIDRILTSKGETIASVIYWPWSATSCLEADKSLSEQMKSKGYDGWEDASELY